MHISRKLVQETSREIQDIWVRHRQQNCVKYCSEEIVFPRLKPGVTMTGDSVSTIEFLCIIYN